jgi:hypothetical protein
MPTIQFNKYVILYNEQDGASRLIMAGNYQKYKDVLTPINWYSSEDAEIRDFYQSSGLPDPSSFPSLVDVENKKIVIISYSVEDAINELAGIPTNAERISAIEDALQAITLTILGA